MRRAGWQEWQSGTLNASQSPIPRPTGAVETGELGGAALRATTGYHLWWDWERLLDRDSAVTYWTREGQQVG